MCNIDCVPETWSLNLRDYAWLDVFCKDNSISDDDFYWLMDFCKRESLNFENFCNLFNFYDLYRNKCSMNLKGRKNEFKNGLNLKFSNKKFIISSRIKGFLRTVKKIDRKISDESNEKKMSWNDITTSYMYFEKSINEYVKDFYGCRVIPVPETSEFSIENLNSTLNTLSPQDFLLKLFFPATNYRENYDNDILYSIKDFFDDRYKLCCYKDFLSTPKSNGYRSLQFGCFFDDGRRVEVQIRNFLHHIYAEYEHRRYEGKLQFSEFIPFYLACEICSNYFDNDNVRKLNFSQIVYMYFVSLSILTNDDIDLDNISNEIDNYVSDYTTENYVFDYIGCSSYDCECCDFLFDDNFIDICSHIIKSVRNSVLKDSQRFRDPIRNQINYEMNLLDDSHINELITSIIREKFRVDNHRLCYKI